MPGAEVLSVEPSVDLLNNRNMLQTELASTLTLNKNKTYNCTRCLLVNQSAHEDDTLFICQIKHDGQPPVIKTYNTVVSAHLL